MKTLTIRGIDPALAEKLLEYSKNESTSINQSALKLLRTQLGLQGKCIFPVYDDLDSLAGTWSEKEAAAFLKNIDGLSQVDRDMWP